MLSKTVIAPHVILSLWSTHDANAAAETAIVHATAKAPLICLRIINLNGLQIGRAIKSAHSIQLSINHSQAHLNREKEKVEIKQSLESRSDVPLTPLRREVMATMGLQVLVMGL